MSRRVPGSSLPRPAVRLDQSVRVPAHPGLILAAFRSAFSPERPRPELILAASRSVFGPEQSAFRRVPGPSWTRPGLRLAQSVSVSITVS